MKKKVFSTPHGTRDIVFPEAYNKRILENSIAEIFIKWGYKEVVTPTYEYVETFELGANQDISSHCINFFDRENGNIALRPDMTAPLARLVTSGGIPTAELHKLFYIANIFKREQNNQGRQCEFYQAGVEYFGAGTPLADAEIIALAVSSIKATGMSEFTINLGHVEFVNGLLSTLPMDISEAVREFISNKDAVGLRKLLEGYPEKNSVTELLKNIFFLKGDISLLQDIKKELSVGSSLKALDNLLDIYKCLSFYDLKVDIVFDLALTRDLQYYSGIVFEAYTPEHGYAICGGGRYDRLMSEFGKKCTATGFAMDIERITLLLKKQGLLQKPANRRVLLVWQKDSLPKVIKQAEVMRDKGYIVEVSDRVILEEERAALVAQNDYDEIISI